MFRCQSNCRNGMFLKAIKVSLYIFLFSKFVSSVQHSVNEQPESSHDVIHYTLNRPTLKWQKQICKKLNVTAPRGVLNLYKNYKNFDYSSKIANELPIKEDANCGFRAISVFVTSNGENHFPVRQEICNVIEKTHLNNFINNVEKNRHVKKMRITNTPITEVEFKAAASAFKMHIYVFDSTKIVPHWTHYAPNNENAEQNETNSYPGLALHYYGKTKITIVLDFKSKQNNEGSQYKTDNQKGHRDGRRRGVVITDSKEEPKDLNEPTDLKDGRRHGLVITYPKDNQKGRRDGRRHGVVISDS